MPLPTEIDKQLNGEFAHGCLSSMCLSPYTFCTFVLCQPCSLYTQRKRILYITGEPYVMCGGTYPCCGFETPAPDMCLVCEVCLCSGMALSGNRFMVQTRFDRKNTGCDNLFSCCQCCVGLEFSCLRLCCDCSKERENIMKFHTCCVLPCTHCQNTFELKEYELGRRTYSAPPQAMIREFPDHFEQVGVKVAMAPVQMRPM